VEAGLLASLAIWHSPFNAHRLVFSQADAKQGEGDATTSTTPVSKRNPGFFVFPISEPVGEPFYGLNAEKYFDKQHHVCLLTQLPAQL